MRRRTRGRRRAAGAPSGLVMIPACHDRPRRESEKQERRVNSLDVLMPGDSMGEMQESIASRLPLHRLWLEADPEAWFAEWGPRIRAIATAGPHAPVDDALMGRLPRLEIVASFGVGYDHVD